MKGVRVSQIDEGGALDTIADVDASKNVVCVFVQLMVSLVFVYLSL